jgi:two-component system LytT family response regulator
MTKIRVVIVDDEGPARRKVARFLAEDEQFEVVGEAETGPEAVRLIESMTPDLIFLDIQMPGLDGFEVLAAVREIPQPQVIFITAYDHFALKAFEVHALDYLLKPFDQARFGKVLDRARDHFQSKGRLGDKELTAKLTRLLADLDARPRYAERLLVQVEERAYLLAVEKIDRIEAARNYVTLYAGDEQYTLRSTIEGLSQKLDPSKFLRANRSQIVNVDSIKELQPWFHGEYNLILKDGLEVRWSRRFLERGSDLFLKLG